MLGNARLAIAGTVLGIAFVLAFNTHPLILTAGWVILVLAYTTRVLPFAGLAAREDIAKECSL